MRILWLCPSVLATVVLAGCGVAVAQGRAPDGQEAALPLDDYDVPPRAIRTTRPQYPAEAREREVEGTVLLRILIDRDGKVARAEVVESVEDELDEAALQCVKTWRFAPATKHGRPVAVVAEAPIAFRLHARGKDEDDGDEPSGPGIPIDVEETEKPRD
jgi:TonB family protein